MNDKKLKKNKKEERPKNRFKENRFTLADMLSEETKALLGHREEKTEDAAK